MTNQKPKSSVNQVKIKEAPVMLDKQRMLRFDLNAFSELEEVYGNIDVAMKKMEEGSIKALRAVLWCGLIHEEEELTQKQVGAMIGLQNLKELAEAITVAMKDQMPVDELENKTSEEVKN